jgi:hypothetical protein
VKAKQISHANLTPSYVLRMNQASACKRVSSTPLRWITSPFQEGDKHLPKAMNDVEKPLLRGVLKANEMSGLCTIL